jgi:hypothetical protein
LSKLEGLTKLPYGPNASMQRDNSIMFLKILDSAMSKIQIINELKKKSQVRDN